MYGCWVFFQSSVKTPLVWYEYTDSVFWYEYTDSVLSHLTCLALEIILKKLFIITNANQQQRYPFGRYFYAFK